MVQKFIQENVNIFVICLAQVNQNVLFTGLLYLLTCMV